MPTSAPELTTTELAVWRGFLRVHAAIAKQLDTELEAAHGLPLSSYDVLVTLKSAPEHRLRMAELADRALLSRSGMTRLVDRLVRDGLIARQNCSHDARGCFAVLTPAGADMLAQARQTHLEGVRARFLAHVDDAEVDHLVAIWERMLPGCTE